jgi:hypothetical protein
MPRVRRPATQADGFSLVFQVDVRARGRIGLFNTDRHRTGFSIAIFHSLFRFSLELSPFDRGLFRC